MPSTFVDNDIDNTRIIDAAESGDLELVKHLCALDDVHPGAGWYFNHDQDPDPSFENMPVILASMNGHLEVVKYREVVSLSEDMCLNITSITYGVGDILSYVTSER